MTVTLTVEITKADLRRIAKSLSFAPGYPADELVAEDFFTQEVAQILKQLRADFP